MSGNGWQHTLRAWARQHLFSLFSSLGNLLSHRAGTIMTVVVLGLSMALPLGLYVLVKNLHGLDLRQDEWGTVSVFMQIGAEQADVEQLADLAMERFEVRASAVSPRQGMEQFQSVAGFRAAADLFDENPLPWVLQLTPQRAPMDRMDTIVAELGAWLEQQDGVELVQVDHKWLQRLASLLALGDAFVTVLAILLALAVTVIVANTIRLDVANRAGEIQILNMVGAPAGFIRRPFLYSGLWYGLMGGLVALGLLWACMAYLEAPLDQLLYAYGHGFEAAGAGPAEALGLLLGAGLLGLCGAWISVQRYLRQFRVEEAAARRSR